MSRVQDSTTQYPLTEGKLEPIQVIVSWRDRVIRQPAP